MSVSEITVRIDTPNNLLLAKEILFKGFKDAEVLACHAQEDGQDLHKAILGAEVEPEVLKDTLAKYIAEFTANRDDVCASGANNVLSVTRANTVMRRIAEGVSRPR